MLRYIGAFLIFLGLLPAHAQQNNGPLISVFPFANLSDDVGTDWIGYGIAFDVAEGLASIQGFRSITPDKVLSTYAEYPFDVQKAIDQNMIAGNLVDANQSLQTSHTLLGSYRQTKDGKLVIICKLLNNKTKATKALFDTLKHESMADFSGICSYAALWTVEASGGTFTEKTRNTLLISTAVDAAFDEFIRLWAGEQAYSNGLDLMEQGRFDAAILQLGTAVRFNENIAVYKKDLAAALMARGTDRFGNDKLDAAEKDYQKAAAIDPKDFRNFYNLGNIAQKQGNLSLAAERYQKAASLDSSFFKTFANLGLVFQQQGHTDKALTAYKKAVALNSKSGNAHYNLGLIYDGMDSISLAIKHYERALDLDKKNADAHLNLGILYKTTKQPKKAEVEYLSAITYKAINPVAHRNIGILYSSETGKWDRAIKHFELSLSQDPNQDDAHIIRNNIAIMKKAVSQ